MTSTAADTPRPPLRDDIRLYSIIGFVFITLVLGSFAAWSMTISLASAVIAQGTVVVNSNVKIVQHPTGGIVGEIRVKDGDIVSKGDILLRLDDTVTRANLQVLLTQLDELAVRQARLRAERDGRQSVYLPTNIMRRQQDPAVRAISDSEIGLFYSRQTARQGQKNQLTERIGQLKQEIAGRVAQLEAKAQERKLAMVELNGLEVLWAKQLVPITKLMSMRREVVRLDGESAELEASKAQAKGKIAETELQIIQVDRDLHSEVMKDLREAQSKEAELTETAIAAKDKLDRVEIRSPQSGTVHQLMAHTVGGVVTQSEAIMLIVPNEDSLVVEAKIASRDISSVRVGQTAFVRLTAYDQRTTPELRGTVTFVSADIAKDKQPQPANATPYYTARISLSNEVSPIGSSEILLPGMPSEVHISTGERTALTYLTRPLQDQLGRAFKEK